MSFHLPKPLVSEISVYSPAKLPPSQINNSSNKSTTTQRKEDFLPKIGNESIKSTKFNAKPPPATVRNVPQKVLAAKQNVTKPIILPNNNKQTENNNELNELKVQLKQQNSEINELKKLIQQLVVQNKEEIETGSSEKENLSPKKLTSIVSLHETQTERVNENSFQKFRSFVDVSVQTNGVCPHCEKPLTLTVIPKQTKRVRVSEQLKANIPKTLSVPFNQLSQVELDDPFRSSSSVQIDSSDLSLLDSKVDHSSSNALPDHQFIDRMLGAAQKWLQPKDSEEKVRKQSKNQALEVNYPNSSNYNYWPGLLKEAENNTVLNSEINSLAARYLATDQYGGSTVIQTRNQEGRRMQSVQHSPFATASPLGSLALATRRQTVTMESEVSLLGMAPSMLSSNEMSISSQEFLRRHGLMQSYGGNFNAPQVLR